VTVHLKPKAEKNEKKLKGRGGANIEKTKHDARKDDKIHQGRRRETKRKRIKSKKHTDGPKEKH